MVDIGLNLRNPIFEDVRTRKALTHLWNRKFVNDKLFQGKFKLSHSHFMQGIEFENNVKPIVFDPKLAIKLFREADWKDSDGDGVLDKKIKGKVVPLAFTIMYTTKSLDPVLTFYIEDAKRVGVDIKLKIIEGSQIWRILNERKFSAFAMLTGALKEIYRSVYHSKGAYNESGINTAEIDRYLDKLDATFDLKRQA